MPTDTNDCKQNDAPSRHNRPNSPTCGAAADPACPRRGSSGHSHSHADSPDEGRCLGTGWPWPILAAEEDSLHRASRPDSCHGHRPKVGGVPDLRTPIPRPRNAASRRDLDCRSAGHRCASCFGTSSSRRSHLASSLRPRHRRASHRGVNRSRLHRRPHRGSLLPLQEQGWPGRRARSAEGRMVQQAPQPRRTEPNRQEASRATGDAALPRNGCHMKRGGPRNVVGSVQARRRRTKPRAGRRAPADARPIRRRTLRRTLAVSPLAVRVRGSLHPQERRAAPPAAGRADSTDGGHRPPRFR